MRRSACAIGSYSLSSSVHPTCPQADKVLGIIFPITAFVAIGFEHSIANMFFLPYGVVLNGFESSSLITDSLTNLGAVTIGNIIGGSLFVAGVYWLAYLRSAQK